jgi:hypothetical protein
MVDSSIPSDIAHFIRECIDRLETLEVLLLLQTNAGRAWSVREVSDEMRSSPLAAATALGTLLALGLIAAENGCYLFRPIERELEQKVVRLADCYRSRRTAVIALIFSKPNDAVKSFAEAFRFKKGGSDG